MYLIVMYFGPVALYYEIKLCYVMLCYVILCYVASTSNEIRLVVEHMKSGLLPTGIMPERRQLIND